MNKLHTKSHLVLDINDNYLVLRSEEIPYNITMYYLLWLTIYFEVIDLVEK